MIAIALCWPLSAALAAEALPYDGHYVGEIVPTPQKVTYSDQYAPLDDAVILLHGGDSLVRLGAEELALHVERLGGKRPQVASTWAQVGEARTVIELGPGAGMEHSWEPITAPEQTEGYYITYHHSEGRDLIVCTGRDALGTYWGAQSLIQLISPEGPRVRLARVRDFPRFPIRCVQAEGLDDWEAYERALTWMPRYKLNYLAFGQNYDFPNDWRKWAPDQEEVIRKVCNMARDRGSVQIMFHLHPHRRDPKMNITISDPAEIDRLAAIGLFALDQGATSLMLRSDDVYPLAEADEQAFADQAEAHAHLINGLLERIRPKHPNLLFLFCPPYYQGDNTGLAGGSPEREAYLRKLGELVPKDVLIIWTGPVTRSLEITQEQLDGFTRVLGRSPFLWDNTLYAHRSRFGYDGRHPYYLFDAFETKLPVRFYEATPGIVFNGGISETYRVARINTADYFWNPEAYDPEASLTKALANVGGAAAASDLLAFREAFYTVFDTVNQQPGVLFSGQEVIAAAAAEAERLHAGIAARCDNPQLVDSLRGPLEWARRAAEAGKQASGAMTKLRENLLLDLAFAKEDWKAETEGEWTAACKDGVATISFPYGTPRGAGAYGSLSRMIGVPTSPTGATYLVFSVADDYTQSGTPRNAWPGYLFKQVLVDGEVVWEDDVEGAEPLAVQVLQVADVTEHLKGKTETTIAFRGFAKRAVSNMGAVIQFANAALVARPPKLVRQLLSAPGDDGVGDPNAFTVVSRFRMGPLGTRQALFSLGRPFQYYGYVNETGNVTAGVFIDGKEAGATTTGVVVEGQEAAFALSYDGQRIALYLDGKLDAEREAVGPTDDVAGTLYIGSYFNESQFFGGAILDTKCYGRALTTEEIVAACAEATDAMAPAVAEGLAGWWREPEATETAAKDLSGNGREGTVTREWE